VDFWLAKIHSGYEFHECSALGSFWTKMNSVDPCKMPSYRALIDSGVAMVGLRSGPLLRPLVPSNERSIYPKINIPER